MANSAKSTYPTPKRSGHGVSCRVEKGSKGGICKPTSKPKG